jgi:NADPH-dependent curcumin reductase CurA
MRIASFPEPSRNGGEMSEHAVEGWVMDHPYRGAVWEPEVEESRADGFEPGEVVLALADWTTRAIVSMDASQTVPPRWRPCNPARPS